MHSCHNHVPRIEYLWGSEVIAPPLLTSALEGVSRQTDASITLLVRREAYTNQTGRRYVHVLCTKSVNEYGISC